MTRHFSDWINSYVETFAPRGEAPERFHFWVAAFTIGGVLRRRVYIDEGTFRWFPNMYVVLVGPPGTVKKSTTIGIGARLLRDIPNIHIGADCTTWQQFIASVAAAQDMFAAGDPLSSDIPLEDSLMAQRNTVTCALSMTISEWGTFINPEDREMISTLTELWDCKLDTPFIKDTKTQGKDVLMNPFVHMIAGTTPKWINDNFRNRFGGWGFSSRCIFLHCSEPERLIAYPHKLWTNQHDVLMGKFKEDLIEISRMQGACRLTPDAEALGESWYETHGRRKASLDAHPNHDPWLSYYLARKFDHAHKLAIALSCSRRNDLLITPEILAESFARCDEIEDELSKIFSTRDAVSRDVKVSLDVANGLVAIVSHDGYIEEHRAYAFMMGFMTGGRARELLAHLSDAHYLRRVQNEAGDPVYLPGENFTALAAPQHSQPEPTDAPPPPRPVSRDAESLLSLDQVQPSLDEA